MRNRKRTDKTFPHQTRGGTARREEPLLADIGIGMRIC